MNWTSLYDFEIAPILTQSLISRDLFHTQKELKDITEEIQLSITGSNKWLPTSIHVETNFTISKEGKT